VVLGSISALHFALTQCCCYWSVAVLVDEHDERSRIPYCHDRVILFLSLRLSGLNG